MGILRHFEHTKVLFHQGIDLLLLRIQLLNLNLADQAENMFRLVVWSVVAAALLFVGLISLLFGLNRVLSDEAAIWVFFGISAVSVVVIAVVFAHLLKCWRNQSNQIAATLSDIQTDVAYLRGQNLAKEQGGEK